MENRIVSNVLEKNADFLSRHLVLAPTVLDKLEENGVINDSLRRLLKFKDTDEQVPFLVHSLSDRGLMMFRRFLAVLRETGHGWMVDVLLNTQALSYEEIASGQPTAGQLGLRQGPDILADRSRLQGMTPEHARMRLTSANLHGRAGGYGRDRYGEGLGFRGLDGGGLGGLDLGGIGLDRINMGRAGPEDRDFNRIGLGATGGLGISDGARQDWRTAERSAPLKSILEGRSRVDLGGSAKFRGHVAPGMMFEDPLRGAARVQPDYNGRNPEDVTGALLNLHGHYQSQSNTNEQTLTVLKREEMAIKELLDQNSREQIKVRRNQNALADIGHRLEEINVRSNDVYDPVVHSHLSRYRLAQLNQIPWSSER